MNSEEEIYRAFCEKTLEPAAALHLLIQHGYQREDAEDLVNEWCLEASALIDDIDIDDVLKVEELSDENAALRARVADLEQSDAYKEFARAEYLQARVAKLEAALRTAMAFIRAGYRPPELLDQIATALSETPPQEARRGAASG